MTKKTPKTVFLTGLRKIIHYRTRDREMYEPCGLAGNLKVKLEPGVFSQWDEQV